MHPLPTPTSSTIEVLSLIDQFPIPICKGMRLTRNSHPIYNFFSYYLLLLHFYVFVSTLSFVSIPNTIREALSNLGWQQTMIYEMSALHANGT